MPAVGFPMPVACVHPVELVCPGPPGAVSRRRLRAVHWVARARELHHPEAPAGFDGEGVGVVGGGRSGIGRCGQRGTVPYFGMDMNRVLGAPVEIDTTVLTGAAIIVGIGVALAGAGALVGGLSLTRSARKWVAAVERSPFDIAVAHWPRVQAAASAGYGGWRNTPAVSNGSLGATATP